MHRWLVGDVDVFHTARPVGMSTHPCIAGGREGLSNWLYLNLVLQWCWSNQIRKKKKT